MLKQILKTILILMVTGLVIARPAPNLALVQAETQQWTPEQETDTPERAAQSSMPYFRFPVVPGSTTSGNFDHNPAANRVTFYDGRANVAGAGFYFSCTSPNMWDWVGCADNVSGEGNCANDRELWYDEHHGTDYEYSPNWHTGAYCDPGRFAGITQQVYAPAPGKVLMAGYDPNRPANGWHIRLMHDLNGNGNYGDDNFRSIYLHFTAYALDVSAGQVVAEGQYLGLGGSTGYSSSPHLHFEVQRSANNFQTYWPVDPYGWQDSGDDPWPYENQILFRNMTPPPPPAPNHSYIPQLVQSESNNGCPECGDIELLKNNGFEAGSANWVQQGVDIIANTGHPSLKVDPYQGTWLGWLGGRNNGADALYQNVQIPASRPNATLRYFLRVDSAEKDAGVYDVMQIYINDQNGTKVIPIETVNNNFSPAGQWVERSFALPDLSPWQGQTMRLAFEARTDGDSVTSFYLDDVNWVSNP